MLNSPHPVVAEGAFLTLHYRLSADDGRDIVSTFADNPATLQLGAGQLSPSLEAKLLGLPEGAQRVFELAPGEAFGPRNADLVQRVSMATLRQHSSEDANYAVGDLVDFSAPGGGRFAGMLLELGEDDALFDFNHPLAGRSVKFEVNIIGIL
ncbi:MAG: FKBP-type peptidyl-prolyl cis-trans isomerase [Oxalobacteraceae bacterium]|jgi:FKBP-type peptidyl-prolyl cis-trans isomerase SlpA|nr:FKBP-type peptidyl-prolyl cis-trans isomerase [Oxalobacteraceae bacterium]